VTSVGMGCLAGVGDLVAAGARQAEVEPWL